jgi:hypothetical protein
MKALRYGFYLAFAFAALLFWAIFAVFVMGWIPFADPACSFEPAGCPPPKFWQELFGLIVIFAAIPATVLVFIFYRRWVRRKLGIEEKA